MIVCVCRRVSDRDIVRHARQGISFDDLQMETGLSTCCGQCESCAREVYQRAAEPMTAHCDALPISGTNNAIRIAQI